MGSCAKINPTGAVGAVIGFSGLFALVALMMTAGIFVVHRYVRASE